MFRMFKEFYGFLARYKRAFIAFSLLLISVSVLKSIVPYIYKLLIDAVPLKNHDLLIRVVLLYGVIRILISILGLAKDYAGDKVICPAARDVRLKIFRHVQDLDFAFHINKSTGSLISIFKRGDRAFFNLFFRITNNIIPVLTSLSVTLFFFVKIIPSLTLVMMLVFIINLAVGWWLIKLNVAKRRLFNKAEDKISAIITDNLINYETVKYFAQEQREERRLKEKFKDWIEKILDYGNSFRLIDITIGILSSLGIVAILWIAVGGLTKGIISAGDMVLIISSVSSFYFTFFKLLYGLRDIVKEYTDIRQYFSILDKKILVKDPEKPARIEKIRGDIVFEKVDFSYPQGKQNALIDLNLHIKAGESVAFVGRSGAGKTTIIKLLLRFFDINRGKILIDNIDIRKFTKNQLRSFIGVVPQEPILFNNTIGFNIAYGRNTANKKEVAKAIKMANLYEFIQGLPQKYETMVGERGVKLSGGQKQRLAIARALLINPRIIIFDEATSNLDSESEKSIQNALWKIAKNRTILIIAHRLSTVLRADKIVIVDNGKIVQSGSHKELIKEKGIYQHLWRLQSEGKIGLDSDFLA